MKSMNKRQQFCMLMMIFFMILTDILICFNNSVIQMFGYLSLTAVVGFAIYFWLVGKKEKEKKQMEDAKKIIDEVLQKKKVDK